MAVSVDQVFQEDNAKISLRDVIMPLFRRQGLILKVFLAVLLLIVLFEIATGPSYTSSMTILVSRSRVDPLLTTESTPQVISQNIPIADEEVNSEVELLLSRDVLEKVVSETHLADEPPPSHWSWLKRRRTPEERKEKAVTALAKKLKIEVVTKTDIIRVSYSSPDPQLAYAVLRALEGFYQHKYTEVHRPIGAYEFFDDQTKNYQRAIADSETKLKAYALEHGTAGSDLQQAALATQVSTAIGQAHSAEQAIAGDRARLDSDRKALATIPSRSMTAQSSLAADKLVSDIGAALLAAEVKHTQLAAKYAPTYPAVLEAAQEVAQSKEFLLQAESKKFTNVTTDRDPTFEFIREDMARTKADLDGQAATLQAAIQGIQSLQARMVLLDELTIGHNNIARDLKANEENYLLYLAKREQERITNSLDDIKIANVQVVVPPFIPVLPMLSWTMLLLVATLLAATIGVASAYVVNFLDSTLYTPDQAIDTLRIPLVVAVRKTA